MNLTNAFQRNTGLTFHPKRNGGGKKRKKKSYQIRVLPETIERSGNTGSLVLQCFDVSRHGTPPSSLVIHIIQVIAVFSVHPWRKSWRNIYIHTVDFFFGVSSRQRKKPRSIICFQYCYSNFHSKSLLFVNVLWLSNSVSSCPIRIWKPIIEDIKKGWKDKKGGEIMSIEDASLWHEYQKTLSILLRF